MHLDWDYDMRKTRTTALIDGKEVYYDACSKEPDAYDLKNFKYIGKGKIHTINGVKQEGLDNYYFFVKLF